MPPRKRNTYRPPRDESPKKPKLTAHAKGPQEHGPDAVNDNVEIHWILPARDDNDQSRQYAQSLFGRTFESLNVPRRRFNIPRMRTPVFKGPSSKRMTPGDLLETGSEAVCRLFETIKQDTLPINKSNVDRQPGPYTRAALEAAFGDDNDGFSAVVASQSTTEPIRVLDQDHQVEV